MYFVILLAMLSACTKLEIKSERDAAERFIYARTTSPASVSPNEKMFIVRERTPGKFILNVREISSSQEVVNIESTSVQASPVWSPDSKKLAFLKDNNGDENFYVYLFDIQSRKLKKLNIPPSKSASIKWSPDGLKIAFLNVSTFTDKSIMQREYIIRRLGIFNIQTDTIDILKESLEKEARFAWSFDSKYIATVFNNRPSSIAVHNIRSSETKFASFPPKTEIASLNWEPDDKNIITSAREEKEEHHFLYKISLKDLAIEKGPDLQATASGPVISSDKKILFNIHENGETKLYLMKKFGDNPELFSPHFGNSVLTHMGKNDVYYINAGSKKFPVIYKRSLSGDRESLILDSEEKDSSVQTEEFNIPNKNGGTVPTYVWRRSGPPKCFVLWVHGGPRSQYSKVRENNFDLFLNEQCYVAAINYEGSLGYGASFERKGDFFTRSEDVNAAMQFLSNTFNYPTEKFILFGGSYGADLIARLVLTTSASVGGVFLMSPITAPEISFADCLKLQITQLPKMFGFYIGENDARNDLSQLATKYFKQCRRFFMPSPAQIMRSFKDEGHIFTKAESTSEMLGDVLGAVKLMK